MKRIRALANMELVDSNGATLQIGSETYFECDKIVKHQDGYVDFYLKNGNVIYGVEWDDKLFENHGVPEEVKVNLTISEEEWDGSNLTITDIFPKTEIDEKEIIEKGFKGLDTYEPIRGLSKEERILKDETNLVVERNTRFQL